MAATAEPGHAPNRQYVDVDGDIHLNGARLLDDAENEIWKSQETLIATAAVKTLNATPVTVVTAPGAGKYAIFEEAYVFLDHAGTDYVTAASEDLVFKYTDENGDQVSMQADGSKFEASADALIWVPKIGSSQAVGGVEAKANAPIVAHVLTGEWATGDSPLKIRVIYRIVDKTALEAIS